MTIRAKAGGEIAPNGEFYKGGQFINTVAVNPKQAAIARKGNSNKRVEIAPYHWVINRESEGLTPIYGLLAGIVKIKETCFKSGDWLADKSSASDQAITYCFPNGDFDYYVDAFNAGKRWRNPQTKEVY